MVMTSRTSRTTTACPCLEAAALAARDARLRESPTSRAVLALLPGSVPPEVLPHDDGHVRDPCGLHTNVHPSQAERSHHLLRLSDEAFVSRHHFRVVRPVARGI